MRRWVDHLGKNRGVVDNSGERTISKRWRRGVAGDTVAETATETHEAKDAIMPDDKLIAVIEVPVGENSTVTMPAPRELVLPTEKFYRYKAFDPNDHPSEKDLRPSVEEAFGKGHLSSSR